MRVGMGGQPVANQAVAVDDACHAQWMTGGRWSRGNAAKCFLGGILSESSLQELFPNSRRVVEPFADFYPIIDRITKEHTNGLAVRLAHSRQHLSAGLLRFKQERGKIFLIVENVAWAFPLFAVEVVKEALLLGSIGRNDSDVCVFANRRLKGEDCFGGIVECFGISETAIIITAV